MTGVFFFKILRSSTLREDYSIDYYSGRLGFFYWYFNFTFKMYKKNYSFEMFIIFIVIQISIKALEIGYVVVQL